MLFNLIIYNVLLHELYFHLLILHRPTLKSLYAFLFNVLLWYFVLISSFLLSLSVFKVALNAHNNHNNGDYFLSTRAHPRGGSVQTSPTGTPMNSRRGRQLPQLPPKGTLERSKSVFLCSFFLSPCWLLLMLRCLFERWDCRKTDSAKVVLCYSYSQQCIVYQLQYLFENLTVSQTVFRKKSCLKSINVFPVEIRMLE